MLSQSEGAIDDGSKAGGEEGRRLLSTSEAILHPVRIEALSACDTPPYAYHRYSMICDYVHCGGRNYSMILPPLLLLLLWGVFWNLIFLFADNGNYIKEVVQSWGTLITPLWIPVSFLMTFRLGRAAIRFWDARAAAGNIIRTCRDASSTVAVALGAPARLEMSSVDSAATSRNGEKQLQYDVHEKLLDEYARWLCAFPVATKNFLRSRMDAKNEGWGDEEHARLRQEELAFLLSAKDAETILTANHGVLVVLDRLRSLAYDICFVTDLGLPSVAAAELHKQMNSHINTLSGSFGAMERISGTPLPFVYVVHLRTFLLVYLLLLNVFSIADVWVTQEHPVADGWAVLLALLATNWAMLGLEAASVECERPFGYSPNHLPLASYCIVVGENVVQTLDEVKQFGAANAVAINLK
ncbi:hypothetical protein ACHAXT_011817 [Thalassiosira profunda]